jgi:aspartyl-tRNA synthetase
MACHTIHLLLKPEDMALLATNLVSSLMHTIWFFGNEIGGGSIRIHDKATQQLMFKYLGFTERQKRNSDS